MNMATNIELNLIVHIFLRGSSLLKITRANSYKIIIEHLGFVCFCRQKFFVKNTCGNTRSNINYEINYLEEHYESKL